MYFSVGFAISGFFGFFCIKLRLPKSENIFRKSKIPGFFPVFVSNQRENPEIPEKFPEIPEIPGKSRIFGKFLKFHTFRIFFRTQEIRAAAHFPDFLEKTLTEHRTILPDCLGVILWFPRRPQNPRIFPFPATRSLKDWD